MAITVLPPAPNRATDTPALFSSKMDALLNALATFVSEANTTAGTVNTQTTAASGSAAAALVSQTAAAGSATAAAASATTAASAAGAPIWVSGTTYAIGDYRYSPANSLTYRRKTAGAGTTDPSADTTNWAVVSFVSPVAGGQVQAAGSVTLLSTSVSAQNVSFNAPGQSVTLPVATGYSFAMADTFQIQNTSSYSGLLKDSTGALIGVIPAYKGVAVSLVDRSTAAGVWAISGGAFLAVAGELGFTNGTTGTSSPMFLVRPIALDANRTLLFYCERDGTSSYNTPLFGVIHDASTNTWGNPTTIRTGIMPTAWAAILNSGNAGTVLVAGGDAGAGTIYAIVVGCGVSGVVVTVNTAATANTDTTPTQFGTSQALNWGGEFIIAAMGANSYVLSYAPNGAVASTVPSIRAVTTTATTVTIGAAITYAASSYNGACPLVVSGSTLISFQLNPTTITGTPYTLAGTTLTAGTAASPATAGGQVSYGVSFSLGANIGMPPNVRTVLLSTGRWLMLSLDSGGHCAYLWNLSGTVVTASRVAAPFGVITAAQGLDLVPVGAGKALGIAWSPTVPARMYAQVFTDTAGTLSVGTATSVQATSGSNIGVIGVIGNNVYCYASSEGGPIKFDCSAASPALVNGSVGGFSTVAGFGKSFSWPGASTSVTAYGDGSAIFSAQLNAKIALPFGQPMTRIWSLGSGNGLDVQADIQLPTPVTNGPVYGSCRANEAWVVGPTSLGGVPAAIITFQRIVCPA